LGPQYRGFGRFDCDDASSGFGPATPKGTRMDPGNVRERVLERALTLASERLVEHDRPPLPRVTPHGLRRSFASLLYAIGETPPVVMAEMGHTDPALALSIYAQAMRRDEGENERLKALVEGADWAAMGSRTPSLTLSPKTSEPRKRKRSVGKRRNEARPVGFEPTTSASGEALRGRREGLIWLK
jgi:hypothetical protein